MMPGGRWIEGTARRCGTLSTWEAITSTGLLAWVNDPLSCLQAFVGEVFRHAEVEYLEANVSKELLGGLVETPPVEGDEADALASRRVFYATH